MNDTKTEITATERKYLWTIYEQPSLNVTTLDIAAALGVKKAAANTALNNLVNRGFCEKYDHGNQCYFSLSERGEECLEYYCGCYECLIQIYRQNLRLTLEQAKAAFTEMIFGDFPDSFFWAVQNGNRTAKQTKSKKSHPIFDNGVYDLPFEVVKFGENTDEAENSFIRKRSMGNGGFEHPAKFVVDGEKAYIVLKALENYKYATAESRLKGTLATFSIKEKEQNWKRVIPQNKSEYILPFESLSAPLDFFYTHKGAFVNFSATATNKAMPPDRRGTILFWFDKAEKRS